MSFQIEYAATCPQCAQVGKVAKLGLTDDYLIACDGSPVHTYSELPEAGADQAPAAGETANALTAEPLPEVASSGDGVVLAPFAENDAAEPLPQVDGDRAKLWVPVPLGGGDVAMLCKFSEAHIQMLQNEADQQNISLGEFMGSWLLRLEEIPVL